jgi:hypothetical protein
MNELRKYLLDKFQEYLCENFKDYCQRHGLDSKDQITLLNFIIDQDLITPTNLMRYTLNNEFRILYPALDHHKTLTVNTLANRFSISERTVWSVLKGAKE